ncbi:MAG: hypothetical protein JWM76_5229, partial [Pseudonocardiales bacterium]|nr:hypothetical protein [Pseudonocardiales bacterium]
MRAARQPNSGADPRAERRVRTILPIAPLASSGVSESSTHRGLSLAPMRALRFTAGADHLGALLCPPYDVIDDAARAALLAADPDNAVRVVLP